MNTNTNTIANAVTQGRRERIQKLRKANAMWLRGARTPRILRMVEENRDEIVNLLRKVNR